MKLIVVLAAAVVAMPLALAHEVVSSPDGHIKVTAGLKGGKPFYSVARDGRAVINPSYLGFELDKGSLKDGFEVIASKRDTKCETWTQVWGEDKDVVNHYNELRLCLRQRRGAKLRLDVVLRVFDDGLGLRYEFPKQAGLGEFQILDELTQVAMPVDAQAWTIPTQGTTYYEALWTKAPLSQKPEVSTPVTIEVSDSLYMVLHDAALVDYASLNYTPRHLPGAAVTLVASLTPWKNGVKVYGHAPMVTPWRTCIIARTPGELITSRLMLNLNEPCKIADTSWITCGKYVGIWWGMHMKDYTWSQGPKHGATTANTKRYIDFAAAHGMKGVLVEGWNYGWDGDWARDNKFDYTKPYPDYDFEGLQRYALSRGVSLIAHNETGGFAKTYEDQLEAAFSLYERMGIHAVKTGYVHPLMDEKEDQHSQYGIRHYLKVIEVAARHHIMVVNHEPAMPSGLCRTYPNLISGEGFRGQEWNAWSADGGNPPYHVTVLPFTRGLAGSMDFTPGIFNFANKAMPGTHPQTTLAKQLAEYVLLYTPWQMAADEIENYEGQPAFQFIEDVPTNFERTVVLNAKIGNYLTIARKDRDSDNWCVGSATDETARDLDLKLDFLDQGKSYTARIYTDGPGADYRTNPYPVTFTTQAVKRGDVIKVHLAPSGGAAIMIVPVRPVTNH